ncbi:carbohydrate binding domain-containing protein [Isoptericola sp. 4D.3]|uniref:non-reducing end alpha-L-arabinofuranosidase n=1 Tax=Isoptericola peretonis TaxID=2918523 RepID=A0ABT0IYV7_9MICO|nr:carbohydrate binding domain-containing protein [Isoptericola sp. 4D.3]
MHTRSWQHRPRWSTPLALALALVLPATAAAAVPPPAAPTETVAPPAPTAADEAYDAYVFPYFAGEQGGGEKIFLAVSEADDPTSWHTLNDGEPVLESTLGTTGLRDPFLTRHPETGTYYLLATDLKIAGGGNFGDAQETGSRSMMVWESPDLVTWSEQREIELAPPGAGNLWAPEATWDAEAGQFVVYWASALYPEDTAPEDRDIATSYQRMLYATTPDFSAGSFSEPEVWIDQRRGAGRGMIDSTIAQDDDGTYHRFTKDEADFTVRQESSDDLYRTQGVTDGDGWDLVAERVGAGEPNPWGGEFTAGEGPTVFPSLTDDSWYMMIDQPSYHGGQGYLLFRTDDLASGDWTSVPDAELPSHPRHGTVLPITAGEQQALLEAYPPAEPEVTEQRLTIDTAAERTDMSDDLYGVFYEDINYAADGGLYAELVRNRSFEFDPADNAAFSGLTGWEPVGGGEVAVESERGQWLNATNRRYLTLTSDGTTGVSNSSYNEGVALADGASYDFSVWARSDVAQDVTATLVSADGATTYGTASVAVDGSDEWAKYTATVTASGTTDAARLEVTSGAESTLRLDMVSLFPQDTWVGPVNGKSPLRKDLAEMVADLDPSFLRFPGGCVTNVGTFDSYVESDGQDRQRTYQWKETIGPVEERPANWNFWGYNQTYGLGYLEYLEFAEDLGAFPLPVVSVGANGCGSRIPEMTDEQRPRWVQDTLDLIEFATGSTETEWGAKRAELGHPEPFDMPYIGLGNEENTPKFQENFPAFRDAIEAEHPDITVISNSGPDDEGARFDELWEFNREQDVAMVDEHYYNDPSWFLANDERYDSYDRNGPHVFLGEYASKGNTFGNALAEAAYMTGLERNSDVVELASYAPMFANEDYVQWSPDMMWFDNDQSWGSVNYYTQKLFMTNTGDEVVPSELSDGPDVVPPAVDGGVFLSTWLTQAAYDDVRVTANATGETLFSDSFSDASQWSPQSGAWSVADGRYVQSDAGVEDARSIVTGAYDEDWGDYTMEVTARKTGGAEGFLVGFGASASDDFYWWNVGGWGNTRSVLERADGARQGEVAAASSFTPLENGRDYRLKVVVEDRTIKLYLDGELQLQHTEPVTKSLFQVVTHDQETGDLVAKVVNAGDAVARTDVEVTGGFEPAGTAHVTEMAADPSATNTKARPDRVVPVERTVEGPGRSFTHDFAPHSITFLRLSPADAPTGDTPSAVRARLKPASVRAGTDARVEVTATAAEGRGSAPAATGTVTVELGGRTVTADLEDGRASVSVPTRGVRPGEHDVVVRYGGDTRYAPSEASKRLTVRASKG